MNNNIRNLIKLAEKFEKKSYWSWNPLNWAKQDPHEKLLKNLTIEEVIELAEEAGLQNVKKHPKPPSCSQGGFDLIFSNSQQVEFSLCIHGDFTCAHFDRVIQGVLEDNKWWLNNISPKATGANLVNSFKEVLRTSRNLRKVKYQNS